MIYQLYIEIKSYNIIIMKEAFMKSKTQCIYSIIVVKS